MAKSYGVSETNILDVLYIPTYENKSVEETKTQEITLESSENEENNLETDELDMSELFDFSPKWTYTAFVNKKAGTVSYYLFKEGISILISKDDSFRIYETNDEPKNRKHIREQIARFIFNVLELDIHPNDIKFKNVLRGISKKAMEHATNLPEDDTIKYSDVDIKKVKDSTKA